MNNGRHDLPWRKKIKPYKVWISEVMLQQTQVQTVLPYFKKFNLTYPSWKKFSSISEDEILSLWSGLGYYRRAKNIYLALQIIRNKHNNRFPSEYEDIINLPGIGRSTAGAIMSIAFKKPFPILDANAKRVIKRFYLVNKDKKSEEEAELWELSKINTPSSNIFEYTQGIMDVGSQICFYKNPSCEKCPLNKYCKSAFKNVNEVPKSKVIKRKENITFNLAKYKDEVLLFKRDNYSIWSNLWAPHQGKNIVFPDSYVNQTSIKINHKLSHKNLTLSFRIFEFESKFKPKTNKKFKWIKKINAINYGMPKPVTHIINQL